jgi:hypothetical protein
MIMGNRRSPAEKMIMANGTARAAGSRTSHSRPPNDCERHLSAVGNGTYSWLSVWRRTIRTAARLLSPNQAIPITGRSWSPALRGAT